MNAFRDNGGILRMSEAVEAGISRRTLYAMRDEGDLSSSAAACIGSHRCQDWRHPILWRWPRAFRTESCA